MRMDAGGALEGIGSFVDHVQDAIRTALSASRTRDSSGFAGITHATRSAFPEATMSAGRRRRRAVEDDVYLEAVGEIPARSRMPRVR